MSQLATRDRIPQAVNSILLSVIGVLITKPSLALRPHSRLFITLPFLCLQAELLAFIWNIVGSYLQDSFATFLRTHKIQKSANMGSFTSLVDYSVRSFSRSVDKTFLPTQLGSAPHDWLRPLCSELFTSFLQEFQKDLSLQRNLSALPFVLTILTTGAQIKSLSCCSLMSWFH